MNPPLFLAEIEGGPIHALHGRLSVGGWCLSPTIAGIPNVRLQVAGQTIAPVARAARPDVQTAFGADGAALECGFVFEATLPAGLHVATLEAAGNAESWHLVRRFTIRSSPAALRVAIEGLAADRRVGESRRLSGWVAHPYEALEEVWISYGNQRVRCEWGLPREDVAAVLPGAPDAGHSGFVTAINLPAGRGPLSVRARAKSGESYFAGTGTMIDVDSDASHPVPVGLPPHRASLGSVRRALPPAPPPASPVRAWRILFLLPGDFTSSRAVQAGNLADSLAALGHSCTVAAPMAPGDRALFRGHAFTASGHEDVLQGGETFDVVHGWTTRESVRRCGQALQDAGRAGRLIVHLDENEPRLAGLALGRPAEELAKLPPEELDPLITPDLSHPGRSREWLAAADGVTVATEALRTLVPEGRPVHVLWPAVDPRYFFSRPPPVEFRRALGWEERRIILFYHGDVGPANRAEVRELYAAVMALNRGGWPCTLLRLGRDQGDPLAGLGPEMHRHVLHLGHVGHHQIPALLSLADYFVQPGGTDEFTPDHFPSTLPEFFALGRPVILPRATLGPQVTHGTDAWVLERADCAGIVGALCALPANPELRLRLAGGAAAFAQEHFDVRNRAAALLEFYRSVPAARPSVAA